MLFFIFLRKKIFSLSLLLFAVSKFNALRLVNFLYEDDMCLKTFQPSQVPKALSKDMDFDEKLAFLLNCLLCLEMQLKKLKIFNSFFHDFFRQLRLKRQLATVKSDSCWSQLS